MILDDDQAKGLFAEFRRELGRSDAPWPSAKYYELGDSHALLASSVTFHYLVGTHTREVANSVNAFRLYLRHLQVWLGVLEPLDDRTSWLAVIEFVEPTADFCLGAPYSIKQRICTSVALLSHDANRSRLEGWRDEVLKKPTFTDARRHAHHWSSWPSLESELAGLNSAEFTKQVDDFRNQFNHGFPSRLGFGEVPFVWRDANGAYVFGSKSPLSLERVVAALEPQYLASLACYEAYVELVREQNDALQSG